MWSEVLAQPAYVASPEKVYAVTIHPISSGDYDGTYELKQHPVIMWKVFLDAEGVPEEWGVILQHGKVEYAETLDDFIGYIYPGEDPHVVLVDMIAEWEAP